MERLNPWSFSLSPVLISDNCRIPTDGGLIQHGSRRRVDHSSSQHAGAVGSDQHGCIRCILDSRGNLQKVGLRNLRHRLVLCDVQFVGQKVHRVLNGPAVGIGQRSKADDSHSKGADFKGESLREIPDCSECHADRRRERVP